MKTFKKMPTYLALLIMFSMAIGFIPGTLVEAIGIKGQGGEISYRELDPEEIDDLSKKWKIEFSKRVKESDLTNELIFVEDSSGIRHETTLSLLDEEDMVVLVTPTSPYKNYETYTIYVMDGLKDIDGENLNQSTRMEFTIKNQDAMTINTKDYEDNKKTIKNETVGGDLIIDGGGEVKLINVEVKGKIIVNDISENSLILDNVKTTKIEVNDNNGARIEVVKSNKESALNNIDINAESSNPIQLSGDFGSAKVNANKAVEIKIGKETSISELNIIAKETKISADEGVIVGDSIGAITGDPSGELKDINIQIQANQTKINELIVKLKDIPKEEKENYDLYLERGRLAKEALEDLLGDRVGQEYRNYQEYTKIRTANTVRTFMQTRSLNTINQVEAVFKEATEWNIIFGEGMKYAAYQGHRNANTSYEWPIISKDIKIGDDITDLVLGLAEGVTEEQLNGNIQVTILHEDENNRTDYLDIDTEKQRIRLKRLNNKKYDAHVSIIFSIVYEEGRKSSKTNFILKLQSQTADANEIELRRKESDSIPNVISYVNNELREIVVYDYATVEEVLNNIESFKTEAIIRMVDENNNLIDNLSRPINKDMKLEITSKDGRVYYTVHPYIVVKFEDTGIIKGIIEKDQLLIVYPEKTVGQIISSLELSRDDYEIFIEHDRRNMEQSETIINGAILRIDGSIHWISIYHELISKDETVITVNNDNRNIFISGNISIEELRLILNVDSEDYQLNLIDKDKVIVLDETEVINGTMKLEVDVKGDKAYFGIFVNPERI